MTSPFDPAPVDEVPLPRAPLVRVLCQVRWPPLSSIRTNLDAFADQLGQLLSDVYPIINHEREVQLTISPEGVTQQPGGKIYRLESADSEWKISLGESFIALETTDYTSRQDFCNRLARVIVELQKIVTVPYVVRIGFRYTNRISEEEEQYSRIDKLIDFSVLGGRPIPLAGNAKRLHSLSEAVYQVDDTQLLVRSANLPAGATMDTGIKASASQSWVLDLDAFTEGRVEFDPKQVVSRIQDLSRVAYKFFRWITNEDFLKAYGGTS